MPFTASHPAAVLPLRRLGLPTAALVIGSVVPDLPYFLPLPLGFAQTHSITGALTVDLLLGLGAFVAWFGLLTRPMVWAAPAALQARIPEAARGGVARRLGTPGAIIRVVVALALGALTHVAWDAFTHHGTWGVARFPSLSTPILGLATHRWLHLASSALGLVAIAWVLARWWQRAPAAGRIEAANPTVVGLLWRGVALWVLYAAVEMGLGLVREPTQFLREQVLVTGLTDFLTGLVVASLVGAVVWHAVRRWRPDWLYARGPSAAASPAAPPPAPPAATGPHEPADRPARRG